MVRSYNKTPHAEVNVHEGVALLAFSQQGAVSFIADVLSLLCDPEAHGRGRATLLVDGAGVCSRGTCLALGVEVVQRDHPGMTVELDVRGRTVLIRASASELVETLACLASLARDTHSSGTMAHHHLDDSTEWLREGSIWLNLYVYPGELPP